jgi:hypothetical protein
MPLIITLRPTGLASPVYVAVLVHAPNLPAIFDDGVIELAGPDNGSCERPDKQTGSLLSRRSDCNIPDEMTHGKPPISVAGQRITWPICRRLVFPVLRRPQPIENS